MYAALCDYQLEDGIQEPSGGERILLLNVKNELLEGMSSKTHAVTQYEVDTQGFLHTLSFIYWI